MNFYELSRQLLINVNDLYKRYVELFPQVNIFDYTVGLTTNEINILRNEIKETNN
jgi:hypothetical protein